MKAPFTEEQMKVFNRFQEVGIMHQFTCCGQNFPECERTNKISEGSLKAENGILICPCGKYTQDWCHDFMVEDESITKLEEQAQFFKNLAENGKGAPKESI